MSSPLPPSRPRVRPALDTSPVFPSRPRRFPRWTGVGVALLAAVLSVGATVPASADASVAPRSGDFTIKGAGFGHGWGMSQYGAYGAAKKGKTWRQILGFYYKDTTLTKMKAGSVLRVRITADDDGGVRVMPIRGLKVHDQSGHSFTVPTGSRYKSWRIARDGAGYALTYRNAAGNNVAVKTKLSTTTWKFASAERVTKLVLPSGSVRTYRGSMMAVKRGSSAITVNRVKMEHYVKGVVPSEMPTSWAPDAVRAQAVAARSYALRLKEFSSYDGYDICDTTACQVYRGLDVETSGGNAAVAATDRTIVTFRGKVALTQFASSNGGHTARGDFSYLYAHADPYDDVVVSQRWTRTISAKRVQNAWPSVGTVKKLKITQRDGGGAWGGRVTSIRIIGSKKSLTVPGKTFQYRFGMRSNLFTVTR